MGKRVVITGTGAVTPLGNDVASTWSALVNGRSGIGPITVFDASAFSVRILGEVKGFSLNHVVAAGKVDAKELRRMDRNVQFAVAATHEAIADAGLVIDESNRDETGVIVGTAIGGIKTLLDNQKVLEERGPGRMSPHFLQNLIPNTATGQVAIMSGARGPSLAIVSACATGGHALGEAYETIRRGDAHTMLAGGTEACLVPVVLAGFITMRALASADDPTKACRPFDKNRSGFVMAEGCSMMVLEDLERARARGAQIYAEIVGYGSSNDAFHLAAPAENGEGAVRAIRMALRKAKIDPSEVDYVNAHGTGTALNDRFETVALKTVFGEHAYRLAVSSTKSMTGHMMGGAGATEALACALAIKHSVIPPTINYETPDPDCDLDYVPNIARETPVRVAISDSFGLGGANSCLMLRRFED